MYIEPETTLQYSRELNNLNFEEHEEVQKILRELTPISNPIVLCLDNIKPISSKLTVFMHVRSMRKASTDIACYFERTGNGTYRCYHPCSISIIRKKIKPPTPKTLFYKEHRIIVIQGQMRR